MFQRSGAFEASAAWQWRASIDVKRMGRLRFLEFTGISGACSFWHDRNFWVFPKVTDTTTSPASFRRSHGTRNFTVADWRADPGHHSHLFSVSIDACRAQAQMNLL
jgi:hypothetical protein